ncbi:MAG: hypothetical protein NVSMB66_7610 [Candidatus Doudnabacteria bacterium]
MQYRKIEVLTKEERKEWKTLFSKFGFKKDCSRKTGVAFETIISVLKKGEGLETTIASIRNYCESQKQSA